MDELLGEFITETVESLAVVDRELVEFERNPTDAAILGNIFRLVHTVKGTCGFLGLSRLERIAHAGETVLGKFRDGELTVDATSVNGILRCLDTIRSMLSDLEATGQEPAGDDTALLELLEAIANGTAAAAAEPEAADTPPAETPPAETAVDPAPAAAPEAPSEVPDLKQDAVPPAAAQPVETPVEQAAAVPAPPAAVHEPGAPSSAAPREAKEPSVANQSIRVPVETLETLMTLVSELVLTRNQLLQMVRGRNDSEFATPLQRLSHITSELQEGVMKTRMQPIGNAWAKLPRIVRDLAVETRKKLDLRMLGAETELDRQVLELIKDPLTHMVRNSADHGIEMPAERRAAGKPEIGSITLNAFHEGGHIIIEISDDGKGLDLNRIRTKAIDSGLATEAEIASMSDQQIYQFVFRAGFSTAQKVTNVSGRGVGMDVVRTNIEKIGGTIELKSEPGKGSKFIIKIPLTLAIVSALILACGEQRFAIPQICVLELVRVTAGSDTRIEMINDAPLLRLRNRLLPLVDLRQLLVVQRGSGAAGTDAISANGCLSGDDRGIQEDLFVVVTQVGNKSFGVIVDGVFDTEEIVVKPVSPLLRTIPYYAGNTILGDGGVIMILDPNGIASAIGNHAGQVDSAQTAAAAAADEKTRLLIFRSDGEDYKAVPLELVARLEHIDGSRVETSQGRHLVQYRGHLMPLVPYSDNWHWGEAQTKPILVFTDHEHSMGLVVDEIVDIVEERLSVEVSSEVEGLIGSAILKGKATDVIDAGYFLTKAYPNWFEIGHGEAFGSTQVTRHVLLVEDSVFFRNLITPVLEAAGYHVTAVVDAEEALRIKESGRSFDAIISDIELPGMNGFELASRLRGDERWGGLPIVALSSYASEQDLDRGRAAGFTDYVAKFDREGLMVSLAQALGAHEAGA